MEPDYINWYYVQSIDVQTERSAILNSVTEREPDGISLQICFPMLGGKKNKCLIIM